MTTAVQYGPNRLNPSREIPPNTFYVTNVKIMKVALYSLGALSALGAVATLSGYLIVPISLPFHPAIALIALALFCVGLAMWIRDYKDPIVLKKTQDAAKPLNCSQIAGIHGIENMIRYKILPKSIDREDFCAFIEKLSVELLVLEEEDKRKLGDFKWLVEGAKLKLARNGIKSYEEAIDSHARTFEDWILTRK